VFIEQATLNNFRNYVAAEFAPAPEGITLLRGDNGAGKTNVLEAVAYVSMLKSFRGAPPASMVRNGEQQAVLRATANREGRRILVETELNLAGRDKVRLNRQAVRRNEDLLGTLLTTIFSPDDIEVVKGAPQARRDYLDDLLASLHRRHASVRADMDRVLKQRNALLRSASGSLRPGMASTLDVWDAKYAAVGESVAQSREALVVTLGPEVELAYGQLCGGHGDARADVVLRYERSWKGDLLAALQAGRTEDVRRGTTSVGPQRDEVHFSVGGLAARTQASQGEQRSLALALRLGGHALVTVRQGSSPVLLLDDIFSELDGRRCHALATCLPVGQALLTSAGPVPDDLPVARAFWVHEGGIYPGTEAIA
jgi:DNA replication and repair protein RecF